LKWFVVEDLGAYPWSLKFKPWWICAYMYVMCIHIDFIMYKYGIWNMYNDGQYFQNILLWKSKPNTNNNNSFKSWHVFLWWDVVKIYNLRLEKKRLANITWWCDMLIHMILTWDLIISMSFFSNYKLSNATCHYPKQPKNISLKIC
jgi:hypothetical protein